MPWENIKYFYKGMLEPGGILPPERVIKLSKNNNRHITAVSTHYAKIKYNTEDEIK